MKKDKVEYEMKLEARYVFQKARYMKQLDKNFSRLYKTPEDYDKLRWRKRVNGRLTRFAKAYHPPDTSPEGIIKEVIQIHKKTKFYVACSGGKDSICLAHYVSTHHPENFMGLMFIDTGVGIRQTKEWLTEYAKEKGWKLHIAEPGEKFTYQTQVLQNGFPGPGAHNYIMRYLKYITMRKFLQSVPDAKQACFISGTRKFESARRAINTKPITVDGPLAFCSPFFEKTDEDVYRYLLENGLKRTPVHDVLGMSGECMCGCFAQYGEREKIRELDPELERFIVELETKIDRGECLPEAKRHPRWGSGKGSECKDVLDPNTEALICGTDCGAGTMRGMENL